MHGGQLDSPYSATAQQENPDVSILIIYL
jgi:hypothetical protein